MSGKTTEIRTVIGSRRVEADGIVSLELLPRAGEALPPFDAGAHVDVQLGPGLVRQYSICSDPAQQGVYRLGILLSSESRGGSQAAHALAAGDELSISSPRNNFPLLEEAQRSILIGGGIGVTPVMSMAYRLHALQSDFEFHYCARSASKAAFLSELSSSPFGARVRPHFDDALADQRFSIDEVLGRPAPGHHLYVCGPSGFMDYVTSTAKRLGWPSNCVHVEYFNANVDVAGDSFSVEARRSGKTLEIPSDKTIAQVLIENGIQIPLSCEQGVCGSCLVRVLEGLPDHRDVYQTDSEKAANKEITVCCSRARSPLLVLDV